jgi:hypothetical protein
VSDLATRAGNQLYTLLPEVYRSRDDGSLAAWLDAQGHLLDLVRNTLEQRLADSFPDEPLDGRACQDWLLPYFAELLEPQLISSDPRGQRAEVANAIAWRQRKGTLVSAEQVAEEVGQIEAEVQEGWKRVALTPRLGSGRSAAGAAAGQPFAAELPVGTVDFGFASRAAAVAENDPAAHVTRFGDQVRPWRLAYPSGAPAFPGSYEDASARTVDLRRPDWRQGHAHPRRLLFYYPPQGGFFPPGTPRIGWGSWASLRSGFEAHSAALLAGSEESLTYEDALHQAVTLLRRPAAPGTSRIEARINGQLAGERIAEAGGRVRLRLLLAGRWVEKVTQAGEPVLYRADEPVIVTPDGATAPIAPIAPIELPASEPRVDFEGLSFLSALVCQGDGHHLRFRNCAARKVTVTTADITAPVIDAVGSLFDAVEAASGLVRLEYVTVLDTLHARRLQVSDSLIGNQLGHPSQGVSVIRYSRTPLPLAEGAGLLAAFNTTEPPLFVELDFPEAGRTVRRPARFGEPGAGVLHPEAPRALRLGAEDGGEIGAYHDRRYSQAAEAVRDKLADYLPIGLEAVLIPDPLLLTPPPGLVG